MSELAVGSIAGLASNNFVVDVASGSQLTQPGMILQVVRATDTTNRSTTSTSFVDSGISVTITPKMSNSVLLFVFNGVVTTPSGDNNSYLQITDNSNNTITGSENVLNSSTDAGFLRIPVAILAEDSPATTLPVTYKVRFRVETSVGTIRNDISTGIFMAIEVAA